MAKQKIETKKNTSIPAGVQNTFSARVDIEKAFISKEDNKLFFFNEAQAKKNFKKGYETVANPNFGKQINK